MNTALGLQKLKRYVKMMRVTTVQVLIIRQSWSQFTTECHVLLSIVQA